LNDTLFQPIRLGAIEAPNRILMAPLTRARSDGSGVPNAMMAEYYAQRASAGLIISEATAISREGMGWPNAPGIFTQEQVEGWKLVTDAVHAAGGRIVLQLWHMGRLVSASFLDGAAPVAPSAIQAPGFAHTYRGKLEYDMPRALTLDEIPRVIDDYGQAAANAKAAGFDGVQLHGANGYLIDQFLRDDSNHREDAYGGSVENRCRLLREVVQRLSEVWGSDRVSVRLSPNDSFQGAVDSDPDTLFAEAARVLQEQKIGFLELRDPGPNGTFGKAEVKRSPLIRRIFTGPLVLNADYDGTSADADVASGLCDAISFGRSFISNPDLVERLRTGFEIAPNINAPQSWYAPGPEGYTDYPALVPA
jgi:2,4-dienoyl-CoA reductase-like NADH-dependent reductase (Old Yellow Enzyme family)